MGRPDGWGARLLALALVVPACKGPDATAAETGSTGGATDAESGSGPGDDGSGVGTGGTGGGGGDDGIEGECSLWEQDCPAGDKCMPWTDTPDLTPDELRCCREVAGARQAGDACMVDEYFGACLDDCARGLICLDVDNDGSGYCAKFCAGSPGSPECEPNQTCFVYLRGIPICFERCNPLAQGCPNGQGCYPDDTQAGTDFICLPTVGGADAGEPCWLLSNCAPGMICVSPEFFPDCVNALGAGCCTTLCDVDEADICADTRPELSCLSWWYQGQTPIPGLESLGACVIPP